MNLEIISLAPLQTRKVAVLGYGNQGRAHALNLRDSGAQVVIGARPGRGFDSAKADGFSPLGLTEAVKAAEIVMFLLPDQIIPKVYADVAALLDKKIVGFAHGFCFRYGLIKQLPGCTYFLAGPKGAGAVLRAEYEAGRGLPGIYAALPKDSQPTREVCLAYCKAAGLAYGYLGETSFTEETECDLFGEQTVLCGGIMQLMEAAYETLVKGGHSPEMAFLECCFEARMITQLWMKYGPAEFAERISPTAFYGGITRGRRIITDETKRELTRAFEEVQSGEFAKELLGEIANGSPTMNAEKARLKTSALQQTFAKLKPSLD